MVHTRMIDTSFVKEYLSDATQYAERLKRLFAIQKGPYSVSLAPYVRGAFLDIHCGTGWWSHQIVNAFPSCSVVGLEHDASLLVLARQTTQTNAAFVCLENGEQLFPFSLSSFDLLHLGFVSYHIQENDWGRLLGECFRLLCPDSAVFIEKRDFYCLSLHPAFTAYNDQVMRRAGHLLQQHTAEGRLLGQVELLSSWLQNARFQQVQGEQVMVPFGTGIPAHLPGYDLLTTEMERFRPLLLQDSEMSEEDLRRLEKQAQEAMREPGFDGVLCLQQVWASKRQAEPESVAHVVATEAMEMAV